MKRNSGPGEDYRRGTKVCYYVELVLFPLVLKSQHSPQVACTRCIMSVISQLFSLSTGGRATGGSYGHVRNYQATAGPFLCRE